MRKLNSKINSSGKLFKLVGLSTIGLITAATTVPLALVLVSNNDSIPNFNSPSIPSTLGDISPKPSFFNPYSSSEVQNIINSNSVLTESQKNEEKKKQNAYFKDVSIDSINNIIIRKREYGFKRLFWNY